MKKYICLALLVCTVNGAQAQSPAGTISLLPRVGATFSNISKERIGFPSTTGGDDDMLKGKTKLGLMAGADLQYQVMKPLALSVGVYFEQKGCTYADSDLSKAIPGKYTVHQHARTNLDYITLPLRAHLYVARNFSVNTGIQVSLLANNKQHANMSEVTVGKDGSYTYTNVEEKINSDSKYFNKTDISIPIGIAYEYQNVVVSAQYSIGLSRVYKELLDNGNKNRSVMLSAAYKFDVAHL